MNRSYRCSVLLSMALLVSTGSLGAQLVNNGDFNFDESDWSLVKGPADNTWTWDGENAAGGAAGSGSGRLTSTVASAGEWVFVQQCVDLPMTMAMAGTYLLRFSAKIPPGQSETGSVYGQVSFYSASGCNGSFIIGFVQSAPLATVGDWFSIELPAAIAESPVTVQIRFISEKDQAGGSFAALFDQVQLDAGLLFMDGFESGMIDAWSATVP